MMPKGVEHSRSEVSGHEQISGVRIPMMPKGVEHIVFSGHNLLDTICENSDDAERR